MKKLIVTGVIIAGIVVGHCSLGDQQSIHQSETISTPAPELGPRAHKLLPNLEGSSGRSSRQVARSDGSVF